MVRRLSLLLLLLLVICFTSQQNGGVSRDGCGQGLGVIMLRVLG